MSIKKRTTNNRGEPYDDGKPRYEVRLRGADGKQTSKTFTRRETATRWEREKLRERDRGEWVAPSAGRLTLREYADTWEKQVVHLKPSTQRIYSDNLRLHILPELGDTQLGKLTTESLRAWVSGLMSKKGKRRQLSAGSVHQVYRTLHRVLESAVADDRIGRNPLAGVKPPKVHRTGMRFLTHDQVATLATTVNERDRTFILVAMYCGLRASELRALRRSSIDLLHRSLTVTEQLAEVKGGGFEFVGLKTDASRRSVPLPAMVARALEDHLSRFVDPEVDALVFTGPEGGPIRLENFRRRVWAPGCTKAGIGHLRIHDARHTCASLAIAAGADVKVLQRMLGHSSAAMTLDLYGHLMPGQAEEVADRLDQAAAAAEVARDAKVLALPRIAHISHTSDGFGTSQTESA